MEAVSKLCASLFGLHNFILIVMYYEYLIYCLEEP